MKPLQRVVLERGTDIVERWLRPRRSRKAFEASIRKLERSADFIEVDEACAILLIGELVATARGWPELAIPQEILSKSLHCTETLQELNNVVVEVMTAAFTRHNELDDVWSDATELVRYVNDLVARLKQGITGPLAPRSPRKKPLAKIGSVFQFSLTNGRLGYGRLYRGGYVYIYAGVFSHGEAIPLGSRDFLFYTHGLSKLVGSEDCPIVGYDPFEATENIEPFVYNGVRDPTAILGPGVPYGIVVKSWQCLGMEPIVSLTLEEVSARVLQKMSSIDQSLIYFHDCLSGDDRKKGLAAIAGGYCRQFNNEENKRFGLVLDGTPGTAVHEAAAPVSRKS